MQSKTVFDTANAMPLKNPATPIPRDTHILGEWEDMKTIKDNTGIDVINEYPAKDNSVSNLNEPCGKSVKPIFVSAKF